MGKNRRFGQNTGFRHHIHQIRMDYVVIIVGIDSKQNILHCFAFGDYAFILVFRMKTWKYAEAIVWRKIVTNRPPVICIGILCPLNRRFYLFHWYIHDHVI